MPIAQGIAKADLATVATGTDVKGPGSHSCARHWLQSGLNVNAVSARQGRSSPTGTPGHLPGAGAGQPWGTSTRLRNPYCANPVLRSIPAKTPAGQQQHDAAQEPL